jgi:eukaryotic-like serine/threonine-protein kinase
MHNLTDHQIGSYLLTKLLGHGDYADVYLAKHRRSMETVALKVLHPHLFDSLGNLFRSAASIMARLDSTHIVRLLDFGIQGSKINEQDISCLFLAMAYAMHGSTHQPPGISLPLPLVINYIHQSAEALQFAHAQGISHQRLKPENILLGANNEILLSDFGFANKRFSISQPSLSSVLYAAPEQLQGRPHIETDQYSLAAIVHEWLSGTPLFTGSVEEIVEQHLEVEPPTFQEKGLKFSPDIEQVIMRALKKEPQERFPDIASFASAFEHASFSDSN